MSEYVTVNNGSHVIVSLPPAPIEVVEEFRISVGAFFDRFGAEKWSILSSSNTSVQALIKDASVRQFIDLQRADLPSGIDMIIAAGFQIDKQAILNTPRQPGEEP